MAGAVGVAPSTVTMTLADGSTIALKDWRDDRLYGSGQFENGVMSNLNIFTNPRSAPIPGGSRPQTLVDTNLKRGGGNGLQKDEEMLIFGIALQITRAMREGTNSNPILADGVNGSFSDPPNLATYFQWERVTFADFQYNNKSFCQGTPNDFPQGKGFWTSSTNTAFELATNAPPSPRDRMAMILPIHLREQLGFEMSLTQVAAPVIDQDASDDGDDLTFVDVKCTLSGLVEVAVR
jgi:hypothetical protein